MSRHVAIIGGGVVGTSCAYYLKQSGWDVTVIDRGTIGGGSSAANCGYVCPSHVLPLTEPGAVAEGLASLFHKNAAFRIKPRLDPALWSWLYHFARRCNERDMLAAAHGIQPLLDSSRTLYDALIRDERLDCGWRERGLLFVYKDRRKFEAYAATDARLAGEFHRPAVRYDGEAVLDLEPALRPGLAGGWHYPDDAHLRPDALMKAWRANVEASGGVFREYCAFEGFVRRSGEASAVRTNQGEIAADAFVLAAGAWSPALGDGLGCNIPIQPGKGYSLTMPRPSICPEVPMIFPETHVAVTPFEDAYRLGSTMEFAGYDESIAPERLQILRDGTAPFLCEPEAEPILQTWFGWRPMTYDGLPIIDRAPAIGNVMIAAGHNMLGLSMATGTGKLVAELLDGRPPHLDPQPYRATRF
ncbi:NAD(P)/FAD-dependent oxidoreductase [Planctomyces sp. SH-PL62]|uniref:NAD(P)/FAD-dependent oxidoreductase n=1 Tax=Planctomyces sp. SH-PL62 TaxID=1636152 RepID=UPI00078EEA45|nr:FAD-dependent oxidoreductase [Planctomyces sp. SH-PL62]AMV36910.1 D-amino acid dehydrogenase small subunit [Planctomyces sp. SH-PL62]